MRDQHTQFVEEGRKLASLREDLIAEGVSPGDLLIPRLPEDCMSADSEIELYRRQDASDDDDG